MRSFPLGLLLGLIFAVQASAQKPEIFLGPSGGSAPRAPGQINYLAKCLANPDDRISCLAAKSGQNGGLEAGDASVNAYVTCNKRGGVCLEVVTFDLSEGAGEPTGASRLPSLDVTILFDFDAATLRASEDRKLVALAAALKDAVNENGAFALIGHTDAKGSHGYNCRLSRQRAEAVKAKLMALGVPQSRVRPLGAGENLLRNAEEGEAAENRRVGFARIGKASQKLVERISKLCPI